MRIPLNEAFLIACLLAWSGISIDLAAQEDNLAIKALETERGKVYKKVRVLHKDPHGITFRHAKGIAKLPFAELPKELRDKFKYSEEEARNFLREHAGVRSNGASKARGGGLARRAVAQEFMRSAYTASVGNRPVTLYGPTFFDASQAGRFSAPSWVYPSPANGSFDLLLWRQLRLGEHLRFAGAHAHRTLTGYGDVRRCYRDSEEFPRVVYDLVSMGGSGRGN